MLGGTLEIAARFPDGAVTIAPEEPAAEEEKAQVMILLNALDCDIKIVIRIKPTPRPEARISVATAEGESYAAG